MKPINVLALCDGMSCGQIALTELGVPINRYYASEIDKFAMKQTQHNFPKTIQLGNIVFLRYAMTWKDSVAEKFYNSKWITDGTKERFRRIRNIDWSTINLILAGTPCQGFSFAGKQLAFDDPRSRLFFVFVDILNHIRKLNPDVKFLLENVNMKKSHLEVISRYTGVFPVRINSNLVSAQNRDRWYWTDVKTRQVGLFGEVYSDIPQPKDRGILLRDILEKDVDEKYYLSGEVVNNLITHKERHKQLGRGFNKGGIHQDKTPTVSSNSWEQNNLVVQLNPSTESGGKQPYQHNRVYADYGKMTCLDTDSGRKSVFTNYRIRRLTPTECARLQTIPDWYEWIVSDTQIYKQCGNGWTIEAIKHILSQWDLVNESVLTKAI